MNAVPLFKLIHAKLAQQTHLLLREERGASLVYIALVLVILLGMAGLAIDGSNAYYQRRQMQTAADAAALAGARALARNLTAAEVTTEVQNMAIQNGADSATWTQTGDGRGVNVNVVHNVNTYFARILGNNGASIQSVVGNPGQTFELFSVGASSSAGYEPVIARDRLLPVTVDCSCVQYGQDVVVTPPEHTYEIGNAYQPHVNVYYGIWLEAVDPLYPANSGNGWNPAQWHYAFAAGSGSYDEDSSGNVRITGTVRNQDGHGWHVDFYASGRTSAVLSGSPKWPSYSVDTTNWYYYTNLTGTLRGISGGRYDGARLSVTRMGPAFQIGIGANMYDQFLLGGASWFNVNVVRQPRTGVRLNSGVGDINIRLLTNTGNTVTNTCRFKWLDWDGGVPSQYELDANLNDPDRSGVWNISEWVPTGPDAMGGVSLAVERTLDDLIGTPAIIPLHDGSVDDDTQNLVCGFAQVVLKSHNVNSGINDITIEFQPTVVRGTITSPNGPDYGARDIQIYN